MIDSWTMVRTAFGALLGLIFVAGTLTLSILWERRPGRSRFLPFLNPGETGSVASASSYCRDSGGWMGCGGGGGDCGGGDG
ncbi:hypothetical protein BN1110_00277 [bacterium YEK0313]|nr:hypothetical protein BN1110_00277 [bacterium YEK0313]